jgi:hypothetical protein
MKLDSANEFYFSADAIREAPISRGARTRDRVEAQMRKLT